ncbi:MAG TPA: TonB family protein [Vicinamibacteria bacterium]|nr:TonB family protein [Vicinamibacteria bacterium]
MALSGNTRELSLADLILVKSHDPGNYRLRLSGPAGDGLLLIRSGRVVHASYGELPAADAAYLLVTEEGVDFNVEADVQIPAQTVNFSAQELLIEAMRRFDEGVLKKPKPVAVTMGTGASSRRMPPRPRSHEARKTPEAEALRRAMGHFLFAEPETPTSLMRRRSTLLFALPLGAVLVVALVLAAFRAGTFTSTTHREVVRLSDLGGPRDALPLLLSGGPAIAPSDADPSLHPTILYRIRVDRDGKVHPKHPRESREGLAPFEAAAAEALRGYRFAPAVREGVPVPIEINWPVDFVHRREASPKPLPVDADYFTDPLLDKKPTLVQGEPPAMLPGSPRRPTIPCRVLIDEQGNVVDASIEAPRPGFEQHERAVLDAVRTYRFEPGRREGQIVPTWMKLSVEFR